LADPVNQPSSLPPGLEIQLQQENEKKAGCLKWSLVGCALLSVLLIIGLVWMTMKAKNIIGWALDQLESQVTASAEPGIPAQEKEAFHQAMVSFVEKAKAGKVDAKDIQDFQKKCLESVRDGKVTSQELSALTSAAKAATKP
jgi:hypothetical protein